MPDVTLLVTDRCTVGVTYDADTLAVTDYWVATRHERPPRVMLHRTAQDRQECQVRNGRRGSLSTRGWTATRDRAGEVSLPPICVQVVH